MADTIGLSLALLTPTATLFNTCLERYRQLNTEHFSLPKLEGERHETTIYWKFRIEEERFRIWAIEWNSIIAAAGTQARLPETEENGKFLSVEFLQFLTNLLKRNETLLGAIVELAKRYEMLPAIVDGDSSAPASRSRWAVGSSFVKKRAKWVLSDSKKFESLLQELRELNGGLESFLNGYRRLQSSRLSLTSNILGTTEDFEELQAIQEATSGRYRGLYSSASIRKLQVILDGQAGESNFSPSQDIFLDLEKLHLMGQNQPFHFGIYDDSDYVLVDWRPYDSSQPMEIRNTILSRIENLIRLLASKSRPEELRLLDCIGYIDDAANGRIGIIFRIHQRAPALVSLVPSPSIPTSLFQLLDSTKPTRSIPLLHERFRLAYTLASAVMQFHSSGWMHTSLRSDNIIFLTPDKIDVLSPYIIGVGFSRPDHQNEQTFTRNNEDYTACLPAIYQHPDIQQYSNSDHNRYNRSYDIYALGVILFEIGLWRRLEDVLSLSSAKWNAASGREIHERIFRSSQRELGYRMGKVYRDIVGACLMKEFGGVRERDTSALDELHKTEESTFYWQVVKPLGECRL